jgi:rhodanese-related sulfurtransferase
MKPANPVLLDVREPWELEICQLAGSQHIPMHLIPMRCAEIDAAAMWSLFVIMAGAACRSPCSSSETALMPSIT